MKPVMADVTAPLTTPTLSGRHVRAVRWAWAAVLTAIAIMSAGVAVIGDVTASAILAVVGGLIAFGAVAVGIRLHLPHGRQRWTALGQEPWLQIALGVLVFVLADATGLSFVEHGAATVPIVAG